MDDLTPLMRERLETWRKNTLPVKSVEKLQKHTYFQQKSRMVRGDYGDALDDLREEYERKFFAQNIKK